MSLLVTTGLSHDTDVYLGCLRMFEKGECNFQDIFKYGQNLQTFESNIAYTLRFMIDTNVCRFSSRGASRAHARLDRLSG